MKQNLCIGSSKNIDNATQNGLEMSEIFMKKNVSSYGRIRSIMRLPFS
jgi:hypothetical protein